FEPAALLLPPRFLGVMNRHDHGGKKGRLRAAQVISPVRVQHRAIMLNLEKEIFDHASCEFDLSGANQPADDEITVPTVHLIETAPGYDVGIFEVQQPVRTECVGVDLAELMDDFRQWPYLDVAASLERVQLLANRKIRWHVQDRFAGDLRIDNRGALAHRAGQRVPSARV